MELRQRVPVTPGMFRHFLAPASAIFLGLGALLGLGSLLYLLDPGYPAAVTEKILVSGIRTASALTTWTVVHFAVSFVSALCPAFLVWSMIRIFRGQAARGMNTLANGLHWLLKLMHILGWGLLGLFCVRFVLYVAGILHRQDWPYQLMATTLMEAMMMALTVFSFRFLCRFLDESEGSAASIGYTLSSGFLDPGSVSSFTATGLTVLGLVGLVLAADRLVTMTIAYDGYKHYYKFLLAVHPGQWLCAGSLFFGAVGNLLLSIYLRFYKRTSERAVFFGTLSN